MFMVHRPTHIVHSCIGEPTALENTQPLFRRALDRLGFNQSLQNCAVANSTVVIGETLVGFQSWLVDFITEDAEETVICAADEDRPVGGFEALVWNDRRYSLSLATGIPEPKVKKKKKKKKLKAYDAQSPTSPNLSSH